MGYYSNGYGSDPTSTVHSYTHEIDSEWSTHGWLTADMKESCINDAETGWTPKRLPILISSWLGPVTRAFGHTLTNPTIWFNQESAVTQAIF